MLSWIQTFLTNHWQEVVVEGEELVPGVLQGSARSFLCSKINDLPRIIFTDDTAIYLMLDYKDDSEILQRDLDRPGLRK